MGLGEALFRSRDYPGCMSELKPLLAGDSAEVQFLYGASLLNLQQPLDAMPYLREAIARDGHLLSARAALGQALAADGEGRRKRSLCWRAPSRSIRTAALISRFSGRTS